MKNYYCLILSIFLLGSCSIEQEIISATDNLNLETDEEHIAFLEQILEDRQSVRDKVFETETIIKYGRDSQEHLALDAAMIEQDKINLQKIDSYLKKYGYPRNEKFGSKAALAPILVTYHMTDVPSRNEYFNIFYQAYLNKDIPDIFFAMYLEKTYKDLYQENYHIENPNPSEAQINTLILELGLEQHKLEVQHKAKNFKF